MKGIKSSRIICPDGVVSGYLYFEDGKIKKITEQKLSDVEICDVGDCWVSPGFIDTHTHGGGGNSFAGTAEEIVAGCNFHLGHGTTSICPTIAADRFDRMAEAAANVCEAAKNANLKNHIIGSHMEGPYLSVSQAGAQPPAHITPPVQEDYEPFLKVYGNSVARWTYAPENDPESAFADALAEYGVVASAGHTDAIYPEMKKAMDHGCNLVTHLYSCTSTVTRDHGFRRLGVIETAWLEDDLHVEIIADGKHLPSELLKVIYKIKGSDRILLCTDSMQVAGCNMPQGRLQDIEFIIEDGVCKLPDRSAFAGSIATADRLVRVMVQEAGVSVPEAVKMFTEVPARVMGLNNTGTLQPGFAADIVIFDDDIRIQKVFVDGNCVT